MSARRHPGFLAAALVLLAVLPAAAAELTVSAAASLGNAFRQIAPLFEQAHPGTRVRLNFGASGALLQQVANGAPVDVFASADRETMDRAEAARLVAPGLRRDVAANALVLVVPASAARLPSSLADLASPAFGRIAIGAPASVPAGRYAMQAIEAAGLQAAIAPKAVGAVNVRQALDYVARGEVDAGFVYATDAALMKDRVRVALTVHTRTPIVYPVAVLAGAPNPPDARRFVEFLDSAAAVAVLTRHGFARP